jgi:hypothetical protein
MTVRTALLFIAVALGSVVGTVALFIVYASVSDARHRGEVRVPFSDLLRLVEHGEVDEITVRGRTYTFKTRKSHGAGQTRVSIGPAANGAELLALRPADPTLPAPRLVAP